MRFEDFLTWSKITGTRLLSKLLPTFSLKKSDNHLNFWFRTAFWFLRDHVRIAMRYKCWCCFNVTRYFSSHDNMTISLSLSTTLISFFLFAAYSEQRNTNEVTLPWSLLYYGVFILNIHERRIFLKSAGEEISHPKPVTDKNKNFMTQLVLSEILHCKV